MSISPKKLHSCSSFYVSKLVGELIELPSLLSMSVSSPVEHGFARASCTEHGSTVNPAARTVVTANTAAIKIVVFIVK